MALEQIQIVKRIPMRKVIILYILTPFLHYNSITQYLIQAFSMNAFVTNSDSATAAAALYYMLVLFYADPYNGSCFQSHIANAPEQ